MEILLHSTLYKIFYTDSSQLRMVLYNLCLQLQYPCSHMNKVWALELVHSYDHRGSAAPHDLSPPISAAHLVRKPTMARETLAGYKVHQHVESTTLTFIVFVQLLTSVPRLCEVWPSYQTTSYLSPSSINCYRRGGGDSWPSVPLVRPQSHILTPLQKARTLGTDLTSRKRMFHNTGAPAEKTFFLDPAK